ncbi:MAG: carbohydrate ABC transporter substrate-binding protein [Lachnospiraceae bacterium]|nr:carbohydrate ABC transporter substrate-binding protein [Lachnospiraceae bacterium]
MRKMRKLTTILLMMAMVLSLGACGSSKNSDNQNADSNNTNSNGDSTSTDQVAGGKDVDVYVLQYKIEINDALQKAIDKYEELYPNVHIELESVGGNDSVDTLYKAKAASGQMPDIFNCAGPESCETYADYLEDLSDQPWVEHANSGMLDLDKIGDAIYGMPVTTEGMGLIVNKAMFEAAGIDISTLDSYDKIEAAFKQLQKAIDAGDLKKDFPNLQNVTSVQGGATWVLGNHAINVALSPEFKEDVFACANADTVNFDYKDAYVAYTELQLNYSDAKDNWAKSLKVDYNAAVQEQLATGKVACIQQGNWIYGDVKKIDETTADNLAFIPAPIKGYKEDSIFSIVSNYWCVNKQSDDDVKEAAKHFLNWLYQSDEGKEIVVNDFGFTPVFDNYGDLQPSDNLTKSMLEFFSNNKGIPMVFQGAPDGEDYTMNVFGAKVQGVFANKLSWDECFKQSATEWAERRASK